MSRYNQGQKRSKLGKENDVSGHYGQGKPIAAQERRSKETVSIQELLRQLDANKFRDIHNSRPQVRAYGGPVQVNTRAVQLPRDACSTKEKVIHDTSQHVSRMNSARAVSPSPSVIDRSMVSGSSGSSRDSGSVERVRRDTSKHLDRMKRSGAVQQGKKAVHKKRSVAPAYAFGSHIEVDTSHNTIKSTRHDKSELPYVPFSTGIPGYKNTSLLEEGSRAFGNKAAIEHNKKRKFKEAFLESNQESGNRLSFLKVFYQLCDAYYSYYELHNEVTITKFSDLFDKINQIISPLAKAQRLSGKLASGDDKKEEVYKALESVLSQEWGDIGLGLKEAVERKLASKKVKGLGQLEQSEISDNFVLLEKLGRQIDKYGFRLKEACNDFLRPNQSGIEPKSVARVIEGYTYDREISGLIASVNKKLSINIATRMDAYITGNGQEVEDMRNGNNFNPGDRTETVSGQYSTPGGATRRPPERKKSANGVSNVPSSTHQSSTGSGDKYLSPKGKEVHGGLVQQLSALDQCDVEERVKEQVQQFLGSPEGRDLRTPSPAKSSSSVDNGLGSEEGVVGGLNPAYRSIESVDYDSESDGVDEDVVVGTRSVSQDQNAAIQGGEWQEKPRPPENTPGTISKKGARTQRMRILGSHSADDVSLSGGSDVSQPSGVNSTHSTPFMSEGIFVKTELHDLNGMSISPYRGSPMRPMTSLRDSQNQSAFNNPVEN